MEDDKVKPEALKKIYKLCPKCHGTKIYHLPLGDVECDRCNGVGIILWGYREKD